MTLNDYVNCDEHGLSPTVFTVGKSSFLRKASWYFLPNVKKEKRQERLLRELEARCPQFIARDFKEFIRIAWMSHVRTSPYYPQSNGKIEVFTVPRSQNVSVREHYCLWKMPVM